MSLNPVAQDERARWMPARRPDDSHTSGLGNFLGRDPSEFAEDAWFPPGPLTFEEWAAFGKRLGQADSAICWWIADWILAGERWYGEYYSQAMDATGLAYSTLTNYAYVANKFPPARRRKGLSFTHHQAVAGIESVQEQEALLTIAQEDKWTSKKLRAQVAKLNEIAQEQAGIVPAAPTVSCPECGAIIPLPAGKSTGVGDDD